MSHNPRTDEYAPWWIKCPDCGAELDERCRDQRNRTPDKRPMSSLHPWRSIMENMRRVAWLSSSLGEGDTA